MNLEGLRVRYSGENKFVTYNGCPTLNGEGEIIGQNGVLERTMFVVEGHAQIRGLVIGTHMWDVGDRRVHAWEGDRFPNKRPITVFYEAKLNLNNAVQGYQEPAEIVLLPGKEPISIEEARRRRRRKRSLLCGSKLK